MMDFESVGFKESMMYHEIFVRIEVEQKRRD